MSKPTPTKRAPVRRRAAVAVTSVAAGASWMALVASTTLGLGEMDRVRTQVIADGNVLRAAPGALRLIVQSYRADKVGANQLPGLGAQPLASTQRSITPEELSRGVAIDVVSIGHSRSLEGDPVIVAWIEQGDADLEFDGARARPTHAAVYGVSAPTDSGAASVVLTRRLG